MQNCKHLLNRNKKKDFKFQPTVHGKLQIFDNFLLKWFPILLSCFNEKKEAGKKNIAILGKFLLNCTLECGTTL